MTRQERAKQFMPFDAMKGLQETLRAREEVMNRVNHRELDEEEKGRISDKLNRIDAGMYVDIFCIKEWHEIHIKGKVTKIDSIYKWLKIDNNKIFFDDIYGIEFIASD